MPAYSAPHTPLPGSFSVMKLIVNLTIRNIKKYDLKTDT